MLAIVRVIQLNPVALALVSSTGVPLLTGIITKTSASSGAKAVINLLLSAVLGAVATVVAAKGALVWQEFALSIGVAWVVSVSTHYGFWKPTGVTAAVQANTAGLGVGPPLPKA